MRVNIRISMRVVFFMKGLGGVLTVGVRFE
jgi:hypothetical protein